MSLVIGISLPEVIFGQLSPFVAPFQPQEFGVTQNWVQIQIRHLKKHEERGNSTLNILSKMVRNEKMIELPLVWVKQVKIYSLWRH